MVVLTSFTQPTDGIRHRQNNTTVYVNDNNLGKGTLYITESCLSWVSDSGNGFSIEYPHISLHAVSRDLSAFPQECLFLMLDTGLGDDETNNGNGENDDENENGSDGQGTTELRLVPDDRGMLDAMFHAMNACQALHPDPEDSFSDEDFYEDASDETPMEEADSRMGRLRIENMDGRRYMSDRGMGIGEGTGEGISVGTGEGISVGRGEGMVGILGSMMSHIRGVSGGISEDILEDMREDILVGMAGGMAEGMAGGMAEDTSGDILDRAAGGRRVGTASGMGRGDRSFSLDNTWHQGRTVLLPAAHSPRTAPEEDSNFADAEN